MTQTLYGLIGAKLGHSYSKIIHEKIADYTYTLLPLPTEAEARAFFCKARICGGQCDHSL